MPTSPLFPQIGVVALVPDTWGGPWQPRHHILTRLSRFFHVAWVNPSKGWRKIWCVKGVTKITQPCVPIKGASFTVHPQEWWLPKLYRPGMLRHWLQAERVRRVSRHLAARGCRHIILYLWRPQFGFALGVLPYDVTCYHIDDEYTFSEQEQPISWLERQILETVDLTFIHSPALMEKKQALCRTVLEIPNGVDYRAYCTLRDEPPDLRRIPHPRIGYVGWIKSQLDLELLRELVQRHVGWSFVFVGPAKADNAIQAWISSMSHFRHVHFLGEKSLESLPAYTQHLDVALMCYKVNDYTKFIYPLKLHEYLAAGKPVVSSPINSVAGFSAVVRLARSAEEWSLAIEDALRPSAHSPEAVSARRAIAREHDWDVMVEHIAKAICRQLGGEYASDVEAFTRFRTSSCAPDSSASVFTV